MTVFGTGSPNLDKILQGGFVGGSFSTIMGEIATGRTTLALAVAAAAFRRGKQTAFLDCGAAVQQDRLFHLGLSSSSFTLFAPVSLGEALDTALACVQRFDLVVLDTPNVLIPGRRNASVAGAFTNWMPRIRRALGERGDNFHVLMTWKLSRTPTRAEMKTVNFTNPFPMAVAHGSDTTLHLVRHEDGIEATVTKNRFVPNGNASCVIKFVDKWMIQDVKMTNCPIERAVSTRFDREDPI